jgi:hypothetical protein
MWQGILSASGTIPEVGLFVRFKGSPADTRRSSWSIGATPPLLIAASGAGCRVFFPDHYPTTALNTPPAPRTSPQPHQPGISLTHFCLDLSALFEAPYKFDDRYCSLNRLPKNQNLVPTWAFPLDQRFSNQATNQPIKPSRVFVIP